MPVSPNASSRGQQLAHRREHRLRVVVDVAGEDAQRAAVGGDLLDIEQLEAVVAEDRLGGVEREVAEVLVVDGVELVLVDQPHDVGELHRQHTGRGERDLHAGDEVVEVRHLSEDVVAEEEVGVAALGGQLVRQLDAEEAHHGRHALLLGGRGHVGRRFDAEDRDAGLDEPLEEVAVVARQLDHVARRAVAEPVDHLVGVRAGVLHPAVGERREVGVLGEDVLGADVLLQLHEPAAAADVHVERVEGLHRVGLVRPQVALTEGRHAEVDDGVPQGRAAEPA